MGEPGGLPAPGPRQTQTDGAEEIPLTWVGKSLGSLLSGVLGTGLPGLGTEHLPGALCSGTGSPALGLCSP